ncbi:dsDNA nuclease domain-containing protein [Sphaerisporangium sp. NPDC049002]|uniref:dsDNA nuclease domain-containing protein n=1 Tax=Sphaerisporangium sp. NPDC049002 TaxID=3155392 RepID=UPI0033C2053C
MKSNENDLRLHPVLDPQQLSRIEATHRGFGYQHLYAVACLLLMEETATDFIIIEHDEDVELVRASSHVYVQVKTRNRALQFHDVADALQRFASLREEHMHGRRSGEGKFAVLSNVEPGIDLRRRLLEPDWPRDVVLLWPNCPDPAMDLRLPQAWPNFAAAFQWCVDQAELIPFPSLSSQTLVLKLAGLVQQVAAGQPGHAVSLAQMRSFLEQLVVQLQEFPQPPSEYRPQSNEPVLDNVDRVWLLVGVSGAGKTAWASRWAQLHPYPTVYFDIGELPGTALASSLARELTARFLSGQDNNTGGAVLPSASGLELLAAISRQLVAVGFEVIVVLDNVHRVSAKTLRALVESAPDLRFRLIGQPWPGQAELEAWLQIKANILGGWPLDTVVAVFADAGCLIDASMGHRIIALTAGVPLYVVNAAQLAAETYGNDVADFLRSVEQRLNMAHTAQEIILAQTFEQLSLAARTTTAVLDLADIPLTRTEVLELVGTTNSSQASIARAIRELNRHGIVQLFPDGRLKLHDAFRLLARDVWEMLDAALVDAAREILVEIAQRSLPTEWSIGRFGLWLRLLPQTGRLDVLIDTATQEQFHQFGEWRELKGTLEEAAESTTLSAEDRFWALDALVYWEQTQGLFDRIPTLVGKMGHIVEHYNLGDRTRVALSMKEMFSFALQDDRTGIDAAFSTGSAHVSDRPDLNRILRYNRAVALYQVGAYDDVASQVMSLTADYYNHLGLGPEDVFMANPEHILATVPDTSRREDDLRRAGDCLGLVARALQKLGRPAAIAFLHAMKFYQAASAWRSAVRVGQDVVDELVEVGSFDQARDISERFLLPVITEYQLMDLLVAVRGQYAVVLAWSGQIDAAREEILALRAYQVSATGEAELRNQGALIEEIAANRTSLLPPQVSRNSFTGALADFEPHEEARGESRATLGNIERNALCSCGSGRKYKRCHGKK